MTSKEIRQRFLDFFAARDHHIVRSSSLVPAQDPTLLFANAGMNQFKDVFLGREKRDYARACSSQKCVRAGGKHNDLEQVGRTSRHHTFFEMLGNFSFGDYFKQQAIPWAWELITKEFAIPREKLYVTVFREDDEAAQIWAKDVGVAPDRIFRLDEKDNFWQMGETGPCGPCSEIHYDLGPAASALGHTDCAFPCECGRYVELWNLVFMQFNRICDKWEEDPAKPRICLAYHDEPLPKPSVDTGAGLERLAAVLQGKLSNFDTDLFRPLIEAVEELSGIDYADPATLGKDSIRIIADHVRAATFLIGDGVLPSNEGRGYVLRRIMSRASYHGQWLTIKEPFLFKLSGIVVDMMKEAYPELEHTAPYIAKAIKKEEERYAHSTQVGLERLHKAPVIIRVGNFGLELPFEDAIGYLIQPHELERLASNPALHTRRPLPPQGVSGWVPGEVLFYLHDTFGLRPDFVEDYVAHYGLTVDREGYEAEMAKQRERARASWKGAEKKTAAPVFAKLAETSATTFDGYAQATSPNCRIVALIVGGRGGSRTAPTVAPGTSVEAVGAGEPVEIVLDHTPFYAEAGGQIGDAGQLLAPGSDHEVAHVSSAYRPVSGLIVHKAAARDTLRVGDMVTAQVDESRRAATRRNHTATHLLHAALRQTLGTHVKQAGSLVAPDRLRFDFTHYAGLDKQDLLDIEDLVNERILSNDEVRTETMGIDAAIASGAMALFDEKYGSEVRVVSVDDFSKELCGGTHVRRTGDIGAFKIISEGSVAAGIRRIEVVTGEGVLAYLRQTTDTLAELSEVLRAKPDELVAAVEKLTETEKRLRKELEALQMKRAAAQAGGLVETATEVKGIRVVAARVEAADRNALRQMVDELRLKLGSGVIFLAAAADDKVALIAAVTQDLTKRIEAGKIVKAAAAIVEGSGGGRKDLAEAGGKNPAKIDECLKAVPAIIEKML